MKLSEKKLSTTHRALVYGEPKSGKTELVGRLSEYFKLLYFDLENGYVTLTKFPQAWQERIELVSIPDTKVMPIGIETALKVINGAEIKICEEHGKVACPKCTPINAPVVTVCLSSLSDDTIVVFDSLTQLANSAMNHITKAQPELYKPEWHDYRAQGQLMDKFLSQVQQASYNVVCITHEIETELEDGKKKLVPVAGTTSFSRNTAKYFDHVIRCSIQNKKHTFASSTTASLQAISGSRTDVELEKDEKPSLLRVFKPELFGITAKVNPVTQGQIALKALGGMVK